ncbi:hypothetical protein KVA01_10940 [Kocuria varians]|uniref:N-acetyltransferase domain-containing protein n=1 Tax=Kocuria varians TaxID=1272 RepID=A0A4Y4D4Q2_KOCVA|nr:GNAT family N-acetyltransferase [Kocuria varians]GEC98939.1 hypothetical protein KVA01_10940 [Kocuria varians]
MSENPTIENPQVSLGADEQGTQRFEIRVDDPADPVGFTVAIDHQAGEKKQRIFPHTEVDDAFGGHGLASTLVREALDATIADGYELVIFCPYIKSWIKKHPEYEQYTVKPTTDHLAALRG